MALPEEFEHVTKYFYNNPSEFNIYNFKNNQNLSDYRFVVDTPEDMIFFKNIVSKMVNEHVNYRLDDLIKLYDTESKADLFPTSFPIS